MYLICLVVWVLHASAIIMCSNAFKEQESILKMISIPAILDTCLWLAILR